MSRSTKLLLRPGTHRTTNNTYTYLMYIQICPFSADISLFTWHITYYLEMAVRYCLPGVPYFTVRLFPKKKLALFSGLYALPAHLPTTLWYRL
jgi:hypothetical protein